MGDALDMKMLRKRIIAGILALTMIVSSLQFSTYTVYAEEIAGEIIEESNPDGQDEVDSPEQADADDSVDKSENIEQPEINN